MSDEKVKNRWIVVVGALLVQICLGAIYAWGTFTPALQARRSELVVTHSPALLGIDAKTHEQVKKQYKDVKAKMDGLAEEAKNPELSDSEREKKKAAIAALDDGFHGKWGIPDEVWRSHHFSFTATQTQLIFSAGLFTFALVMILAGRWQDKVGPRVVALIGGLVLGAGYVGASLAGTGFWAIFLLIGIVGGAGIGLGYVCPIAACVKWFPDMKGFITGLAVAGFGAGAFVFVKLGGEWANLIADYGVSTTFLIFGIIFAVVVVLGALMLSNPPPGWKPAGWKPPVPKSGTAPLKVADLTQGQCVRTGRFWMIWLAFVFSAGCGLMVIGCLKDFGIKEGKLSPEAAGTALGLLALFNGLGRVVWGTLSQKLGPRRALVVMLLLQAIMMFLLLGMGSQVVTLTVAACWIGFNFGGNFALFPLLTAESFGTKNLGANYGAVFTAYGIGGIVGPLLSGRVWDTLHSYQWAFIPAGVACVLAMVLAILMRPPRPAARSSSRR